MKISEIIEDYEKNIVNYNRHSVAISFVVTLIIIISIVIFITNYVENLNKSFEDEINTYMEEIANQSASVLEKQINGELKTLEAISGFIGCEKDFSIEKIVDALNKISKNNNFKRMGIICPDGKAYTTDNYVFDLSDRSYFQNAMQGESCVSDVITDKMGEENNINVYSTPIYSNDEIVGVLFATHSIDEYQKTMSVSTFGGEGYSYITKDDGDVVVGSVRVGDVVVKDNIFQAISESHKNNDSVYRQNINQMKYNMSKRRSGNLKYYWKDSNKYLNYRPMNVNDWYFVSVVPSDLIDARKAYIVERTIYACAVIIALFVLLLVYINIMQGRNKNKLSKIAFYDEVTGARNLNKFKLDAIEAMRKRPNAKFAVGQFDIDKFKYVNDMMGYEAGNKILRNIAEALDESLKKDEVFARTSSDYFVVLINYNSEEEIIDRFNKFKENVNELTKKINNYKITISCGLYIVTDRSQDIVSMIDRAGTAQKTVKGYHKTTYAFYDEAIRNKGLKEKEIENTMNEALDNGEFVVYLQPKYCIETATATGSEALVRWNHPKNGLIPPVEFIPLFEKNGFIENIDMYVLEEVCKKINQWKNEGINADLSPISVNMSRIHLYNACFIEQLKALIVKYNIDAKMIEIELTESIVFDNINILLEIMSLLHEIGFKISMDDFGSGYSSLNLLKEIPVDILKIDREFFNLSSDDEKGKQIIETIVKLAKTLKMKVVAEGVETENQVNFLKGINCDMAQGYYYSKPMPMGYFEQKAKK